MNFSINSTSFNSVKGYLILSWIHLLSILHLSLGLEGEFPTTILVNGQYVIVLCDTGSDGALITKTQAKNLGLTISQSIKFRAKGLGGAVVQVIGVAENVVTKIGKETRYRSFFVVDDHESYTKPILPFSALSELVYDS